ncbi:MAG TPA: family 16 glycosylhydrolase [Polyangiaceae bacterium]
MRAFRIGLAATWILACGSPSESTSGEDGGKSDATFAGAPDGAAEASGDAGSPIDATTAPARDGASGGVADSGPPSTDASADADLPGWTLTWSDEFDEPDGSAVDPTKWAHEVGGTGWGNQELEYYTDGTANAVVTGGNLVITATAAGASSLSCWYGPCQYTSARLKTEGLFAQAYGRFEARIQLPAGQGLWPAFWTLGDNISSVSWPACGEIDIMEAVDGEPLRNHGSLHGPVSPGSSTSYNLTGTAPATTTPLSTSFHTYAVEWDPGTVRFLVDDVAYETQTTASLTQNAANGVWEFDHPFFILLNVAVGGNFPGPPDAAAVFPQAMKVDWVRVYERAD